MSYEEDSGQTIVQSCSSGSVTDFDFGSHAGNKVRVLCNVRNNAVLAFSMDGSDPTPPVPGNPFSSIPITAETAPEEEVLLTFETSLVRVWTDTNLDVAVTVSTAYPMKPSR